MNEKHIAIYALYDRNGVRYVGQTANLKRRMVQHNSGPNKEILGKCRARVLRYVTDEDASRIETQVIVAYFKRGQADLNKFASPPLVWVKTNRIFPTMKEAAEFFNCSSATIRRSIGTRRFDLIPFRPNYAINTENNQTRV